MNNYALQGMKAALMQRTLEESQEVWLRYMVSLGWTVTRVQDSVIMDPPTPPVVATGTPDPEDNQPAIARIVKALRDTVSRTYPKVRL